MIAFDTETHLIQPGLAAPPLVCVTADDGDGPIIMDSETGLSWFEAILDYPAEHLIGANVAYDMAVMAAAKPKLLPKIMRAYWDGRVHDVLIRQTLDAIAHGYILKDGILDPRTGSKLKDAGTGKMADRYSLAACADLVLGIHLEKADTYRLKYKTLEHLPIDQWPLEARVYALKDAEITWKVWQSQESTHQNLGDEQNQVKAAWCLHLGAIWGFNTDPARVEALAAAVDAAHFKDGDRFRTMGFIKPDGKEDGIAVTKALCKAYGVTGVCVVCEGAGKVLSEKTKKPIQCKGCDATGMDLDTVPALPRTPTGGVSTARDTLRESGDETLEQYAEVSWNEKLRTTYVPYLRQATKRPMTLRPNSLLSTGRASYSGLIQLLPRQGGVRECFKFRGVGVSIDYSMLELCALSQINLWLPHHFSRMAEALQRGEDLHSRLGARIGNSTYEDFLKSIKSEYADVKAAAKNLRQLSKPVNFGLGGGMSAPKLVETARKEGVTVCPDGFVHKGTRFCVLSGHATRCGLKKITEYWATPARSRPIIPTCVKCLELAVEYIALWFEEFPEMDLYFDWIKSQTKDVDFPVMEQWGSGRIRGGVDYKSGANTNFQGLASDGAKFAFCNVTWACFMEPESPVYGDRPVLLAHDEIVAELAPETAHESAHEMAKIMRDSMQVWIPDVPIKAEPALMEYWYKGAEPVYKDGRLVPWRPSV